MDEKLLSLPWQVQVSLGSGYAAYLPAYAGIRAHHKNIDILFRAVAFGLVATCVLVLSKGLNPTAAIVLAFLATVATGLVWRKVGIAICRALLRWGNVSWADDVPSAWLTVGVENNSFPVSQISVLMDDGTWLNCSDTRPFANDPFGPCTLGLSGDIALYVTDEEDKDGNVIESKSIRHETEGVRLTYVPAERVRRVSIRHIATNRVQAEESGKSGKEAAAAALDAQSPG